MWLFIIHHCQSVLLQRGVFSVHPSHDQIWYKFSWKYVYTGNTVEKLLKPTRHFLFWERPWHRVISPSLSRRRGIAGECHPPPPPSPRWELQLGIFKNLPGSGLGVITWRLRRPQKENCRGGLCHFSTVLLAVKPT